MKDFPILFEDESMLIINKPAGVVVNNAESAKNLTVQEWAEERLGTNSIKPESQIEEEFVSRGGVVHRLDKETSGILIISKTPDSFENLKNQFKGRGVEKKYVALAHGRIEPATGEVNMPIGRLPWNRTRFGVLADGREAKTLYKVLEYRSLLESGKRQDLTYVELYPKTGRTHQIRVHLLHLGYPIFADALYAGRKQSRHDRKLLSRHFLHASEINIVHPLTDEEMKVECALPEDLENFLLTTILQK